MYVDGDGIAQNDRQAVAWFERAAGQGFAAAENNLAFMFENGRGVEQGHSEGRLLVPQGRQPRLPARREALARLGLALFDDLDVIERRGGWRYGW